jgi:hypothetical protein
MSDSEDDMPLAARAPVAAPAAAPAAAAPKPANGRPLAESDSDGDVPLKPAGNCRGVHFSGQRTSSGSSSRGCVL